MGAFCAGGIMGEVISKLMRNGVSGTHFPTVSRSELIDFLKGRGYCLRLGEYASSRSFNWVAFCENSSREIDSTFGMKEMLLVCDESQLNELSERFPYSFFVATVKDEDKVVTRLGGARYVGVASDSSRDLFCLVKDFFTDNMLWESRLDYAVYRKERMEKLLDVAAAGFFGGGWRSLRH